MLIKSDTFFVISNFNFDPIPISEYASNFIILDQSNDPQIYNYLKGLSSPNIRFSKHVGHNIVDYLDWIIENWEDMPTVVAFLKGNSVGRHIDQAHWEKIYRNKHYTFVYNDLNLENKEGTHFSAGPSDFNEINNSWFAWSSHHRYFTSTNQLIEFLYKEPRIPDYLTFAPGACYIVESSRIKNKPISLWIGLREILNYEFFPSEAWMVERLLHTIFFSEQEFNDYVYNVEEFLEEISRIPDRSLEKRKEKTKIEIVKNKLYFKAKSILKTGIKNCTS
jgi:hypothetical protein